MRVIGIARAGTSNENFAVYLVRLEYSSYDKLGVSGRLAQCSTISWSGGQVLKNISSCKSETLKSRLIISKTGKNWNWLTR